MATPDEIKKLQQQGRSDQEIIQELSAKGVPETEISEALAESKIKAAVTAPAPGEEMMPSMMVPEEEAGVGEQLAAAAATPAAEAAEAYAPPAGEYPEAYPSEAYGPEAYGAPAEYYQYPAYQAAGLSPDTITEIAEQVVSERLEDTRDKLQKLSESKTTVEANIENLNERLQRIEKIIDRLQLSVLQKVGEYVTNVEDIKRELIETQKSFRSLLPELKKPQQPQSQSQKSRQRE